MNFGPNPPVGKSAGDGRRPGTGGMQPAATTQTAFHPPSPAQTKSKAESFELRVEGSGQGRLQWVSRPRIVNTDLARRRVWISHCRRFSVEHAISHYGLPDIWPVFRRRDDSSAFWDLVSKHPPARRRSRRPRRPRERRKAEG